VRVTRLIAFALSAAFMFGCFAESGLRDEFREATRSLDNLIEEVDDQDPIREAADRARDTVDEAQGALEAYRDNPSAETRQALENAERRIDETRSVLSRLLERAPEGLRRALGEVVDALEGIRKEIRRELED